MFKITVFILSLFLSFQVLAGNPAPLYDRPVKLDDSGQPIVNSWEQYEYLRKNRNKPQGQPQPNQQTIDLPEPQAEPETQNNNNQPMPVVNPHSPSRP